ncbi:MAG TPA: AhpC/TSA family protein [Candidatus Merdimorpha stercoravium]|uniref:AhpC/TSA family protein n=1 Tax=Candidatus Merdimorpha stercoravium TaxID=2840863 RepID=A0A9D1HAD2_9FLAO|nr:AhpC/TSA family protein [Candidatus Merdimorpha stercoravium]
MKRYAKWFAIVFLVLCFFFSCTQVRKNTITGHIEGLQAGDRIVLASWHASQDRWVADDSVTVRKPGEFTLKTYDKDEALRLFLVPQGDTVSVSDGRTPYLSLFVEGLGEYTLTGEASDFPSAKISGGVYEYPEVRQIDSLSALQAGLRQEYAALDRTDTAALGRFSDRWQAVADSILAARQAVVRRYPDNRFAAWVLADLGYLYDAEDIDEIDSLYQGLSEQAQKCLYGRQVRKLVDNVRHSALGATAPDFTLTTLEGDTLRLSALRGKWTVVDFWASWCNPCRKYNPHMVELYEKYHPAGLEVVGVAVWDQQDDWRRAVAEDALPWANVNAGEKVKGQDNVGDTYAIRSVPTTLLLDPEGKIVYRGHPAEIEAALREAFPKVK